MPRNGQNPFNYLFNHAFFQILTGPGRMDWEHVVYDTEAQTGKRDEVQQGAPLRDKNGETARRRTKDISLTRDYLGDGGYLRRSRSSQSTGCGLLDLGDACEYEKWVAGGVGWLFIGVAGIYLCICS